MSRPSAWSASGPGGATAPAMPAKLWSADEELEAVAMLSDTTFIPVNSTLHRARTIVLGALQRARRDAYSQDQDRQTERAELARLRAIARRAEQVAASSTRDRNSRAAARYILDGTQ